MQDVNEVIISNYMSNGLYFSVAASNSTGKILKITLPKQSEDEANDEIIEVHPNFKLSGEYRDVAKDISGIYHGKKTGLELDVLELDVDKSNRQLPVKSEFMRNVLVETFNIPYGEVGTYKSLGDKLGTRAYRAVGTVMARNPFPLLVPCHRVVKSDLTLGNYGGGREMKREILKKEGVVLKGDKIIKKYPLRQ